ncbi:hypothetical protein FNV43_RR05259 [Rhamnella rubrinervis]|uniref:Polymerase nucleotidyl transferase domain-containing protein n=1 Tax=Rhamnella rubrinervis TaxID=2594499 RepID=A0A8K0HLS3_9ROSA|nr:hypothetical protein FNV43_RR05259 [Rhamnella rubrinervis]
MSDLQVCSLPNPNDVIFREDRLCPLSSSPPSSASNPDPSLISADSWARAETTTQEIVSKIQPTLVADQKRKDVIDYVQRLLRNYIGCEVFPYGSVPLKTYLPDGDIDLTAFSSPKIEDALASHVHAALRGEEHNEAAQYKVKDVHCIDAEVKLVKCIVQNVVVDISFNQLGGLSTLCFLEQVDRLTGKDHLFKRSIILIKAWCYYESRILGAHHGLISTYALEILVLYIFHQFTSSLNGPLAVLYRFLDYFSKFDWDNYCVGLNGPVCKSSLPNIVADLPKNKHDGLLLSQEFLRNCMNMFSVPSCGLETNTRAFSVKHLNIIDPLKENNNLGRSVNRGNFYRIRSAFKYGARKLGWILSLPGERIADELKRFFANTLDLHGSNCWTDVQNSSLAYDVRVSEHLSSASQSETFSDEKNSVDSIFGFKVRGTEAAVGLRFKPDSHILKAVSSYVAPEFGCDLDGEVKEGATSGILGTRNTNGPTDLPVNGHLSTSVSVSSDQSNHFCSLKSCMDKGKIEKFIGSATLSDVTSVAENTNHVDNDSSSISGGSETFKLLLDLSGEYDTHFSNLQYGQLCHGYSISPSVSSPPLSPKLPNKKLWESVHKSMQFPQTLNCRSNGTSFGLGSHFYPPNPSSLLSVAFGEENNRPRGTGTYIPNVSYRPYRDRAFPGGGRNQATGNHAPWRRYTHNNSLSTPAQELTSPVECKNELSQAEYPVLRNGKFGSSDYHQSQMAMRESFHTNAYSHPSEKLERVSSCPKTWPSPLPDRVHQSESDTKHLWEPALNPLEVAVHSCEPLVEGNNHERVEEKSYHLKNEDDFPPLSV